MPAVDSSAVARVEYHPKRRALDIWFHGSGRYRYFEVPPSIYHELLQAPSIGTYVNRRIKPFHRYSRE